jgi:hypothetical protein
MPTSVTHTHTHTYRGDVTSGSTLSTQLPGVKKTTRRRPTKDGTRIVDKGSSSITVAMLDRGGLVRS